MIISHGRRYIFVHIPKTGGTSLALALEARAMADDVLIGDTPKAIKRRRRLRGVESSGRLWKHSRLADIEGLVTREQMAEYFTFTLVRNPWDRMVSYYHWLQAQTFDHPAVTLAKTTDFKGFMAHPHTHASLKSSPYDSYMRDTAGVEHCNAYIRIEHLGEDLAGLSDHLEFVPEIPVVNTSKREKDWRGYYEESTKAVVESLCAADIERFGYRFDC